MRSARGIPLLALLLMACGGHSGYGSPADVAKAAGCGDFTTSSASNGVMVGQCSYQGHSETVLWFPSTGSADGWRSLGKRQHSNELLFDGQWIVRCAAVADCADFKTKLGGTLE
jgi:hypothetical protein